VRESFERAWLELPEVALVPPNYQVGGERDWGDSFFDLLLQGVADFFGEKVRLFWPVGSILAQRDKRNSLGRSSSRTSCVRGMNRSQMSGRRSSFSFLG
jgi:hypothetical protein